jgi:hypothetical protein
MNWRTADMRMFTVDPKTGKMKIDHGENERYYEPFYPPEYDQPHDTDGEDDDE